MSSPPGLFQCDNASIAVALVTAWAADENIDILSPQLYSSGTETTPEFDETSFCAGAGCTWDLYVGARAAIAPSIVVDSQYGAVQSWFAKMYGITTAGFIQWEQVAKDSDDSAPAGDDSAPAGDDSAPAGDDGSSSGNVCLPDTGCNVCDSCCQSYLGDQDSCDSCFEAECAVANVCLPASGCNVCESCCASYLGDQDSCDGCVEAECAAANVCAGDDTCTACDSCCVSYLSDQDSCDGCVSAQC